MTILYRGVGTYTDTPDWSGQSFGTIILDTWDDDKFSIDILISPDKVLKSEQS